MGIKRDLKKPGTFIASHSKRHPVTNIPYSLRRKGFKTEAEAKRAFNQLVVDVEDKIRSQTTPSWEKMTEDFLLACKARGLTGKTVLDYGLCLRANTYEAWATRAIDRITTHEIREHVASRSIGKAMIHQKNLLKFIRGVFNYAVETGVISRNPTPDLRFKVGDKIRRVLTEPQAKLLLERAKQMESDWYPHWTMALYTGLRSGELYALTWDKVNFHTEQIVVDSSWNCVDGFKSTKSGDDRIVDIAAPLMTMLRQWKLERSDSAFILPRLDKWEVGEQARELRMFLMGIGIPPVRFHDLRATWATMMLSKGVEPIKVMSMGGWKDIKTLMIYTRKAGVDVKGVAACLNDLHNPSNEGAKVFRFGGGSDLS